MNLLVPTPIYDGYSINISWDLVDGATEYELHRKLDSEEFNQVYKDEDNNFLDSIPRGNSVIQYRIRYLIAEDISWEYYKSNDIKWSDLLNNTWDITGRDYSYTSDWTYGEELDITPNRPPIINGEDKDLGEIYDDYYLEYSVNDPDPENKIDIEIYIDDILKYQESNVTQDQIYNFLISPNDFDYDTKHDLKIIARDNWGLSSERNYSFTSFRHLNPQISGENEDFGILYEDLEIEFSVDDQNKDSVVDVSIYIDGNLFEELKDITLNKIYSFTVEISNYEPGKRISIEIVASNNKGLSDSREYTYFTQTQNVYDAVYYIYVDGIPKHKTYGTFSIYDYLHVGCHEYFVRGVLNEVISDSNTITLCSSVEASSLSIVDSSGSFAVLNARINERPQITSNYNNNYMQFRFLGNEKNEYLYYNSSERYISISFTILDEETYWNVNSILQAQKPILYRDRFENRIIGVCDSVPFNYLLKTNGAKHNFRVSLDIQIDECEYKEEIEYD